MLRILAVNTPDGRSPRGAIPATCFLASLIYANAIGTALEERLVL